MHEAKTHLSKLVQAALDGEEVVIAKNGTPLVKLVPCEPVKKKLRPPPGLWKGQIWIADDFDAPSQEIIEMFEGNDEEPAN